MHAVRAQVRNGRLVIDEPTDLPEGEVVDLVPLQEVLAEGIDDLSAAEREELHAAIREGFEDAKAGRTIDVAQWKAELRSRL